jgi:hypothetical protein
VQEKTMKKTTRRLAQRVKPALLDLPDALLLETIDGWLTELDALFVDSSVLDESYGMLGYRARSEATGRSYASLDALDESEPEVEEFSWMPPAAQELRENLRTMQPTRVYHTVVALAGEVFRQKPFAVRWGEPPGGQADGYVFIRALVGYLVLRKAGGDIALEQFEALYSEQLEGLAAVPPPPKKVPRPAGLVSSPTSAGAIFASSSSTRPESLAITCCRRSSSMTARFNSRWERTTSRATCRTFPRAGMTWKHSPACGDC